jgi:hypothetical protein
MDTRLPFLETVFGIAGQEGCDFGRDLWSRVTANWPFGSAQNINAGTPERPLE